jgi:hypothetical protein
VGTLRLVRRIVDLLDLDVDVSGDGPVDSDLRSTTIAALAEKAHCV